MHGITEIAEELIKEIMDSSFISSAAKREYCEFLKTLMPEKTNALEALAEDREVFVARIEYKEKMTSLLSMTLGTIVAFATMLSFINNRIESSSIFGKLAETILPMFLVMFSVILVMTFMQVALKLRCKKIRAENGVLKNKNQ